MRRYVLSQDTLIEENQRVTTVHPLFDAVAENPIFSPTFTVMGLPGSEATGLPRLILKSRTREGLDEEELPWPGLTASMATALAVAGAGVEARSRISLPASTRVWAAAKESPVSGFTSLAWSNRVSPDREQVPSTIMPALSFSAQASRSSPRPRGGMLGKDPSGAEGCLPQYAGFGAEYQGDSAPPIL